MAATSNIEWTDATLNFWLGCDKVSPACRICYIVRQTPLRVRGLKHGDPRERTKPGTWKQAYAWNRKAAQEGRRRKVFGNSLSDWLDDQVPIEWLADMLQVVHGTPFLIWQLLTKRPQNWRDRVFAASCVLACRGDGEVAEWLWAWLGAGDRSDGPGNVWIGATMENQEMVDLRHAALMAIPARVHFWSSEPLLSAIDAASAWDWHGAPDWVIAGGESGYGSDVVKPSHPDWFRGLRDECLVVGVPFFFKQWGDWIDLEGAALAGLDLESQDEVWVQADGLVHRDECPRAPDDLEFIRVGKKCAGRLLDGREWNGLPLCDAEMTL